jgi:hypothetical protein
MSGLGPQSRAATSGSIDSIKTPVQSLANPPASANAGGSLENEVAGTGSYLHKGDGNQKPTAFPK